MFESLLDNYAHRLPVHSYIYAIYIYANDYWLLMVFWFLLKHVHRLQSSL